MDEDQAGRLGCHVAHEATAQLPALLSWLVYTHGIAQVVRVLVDTAGSDPVIAALADVVAPGNLVAAFADTSTLAEVRGYRWHVASGRVLIHGVHTTSQEGTIPLYRAVEAGEEG